MVTGTLNWFPDYHFVFNLEYKFGPWKVIRIPKSGKFLLVESGILRSGTQNPVPVIRNPRRGIQNPRLSWIHLHGAKRYAQLFNQASLTVNSHLKHHRHSIACIESDSDWVIARNLFGADSTFYNYSFFIVEVKYRKIPKISPGAYIFQRPFLRGLFLEGLIFGGAYLRREIGVWKSIGLAL